LLAKCREHAWLEGWLFRGEDPPPNVVVATVEQIRYYRRLWDFKSHCRQAGLSPPNTSYCNWISPGVISNLELLEWLYGETPPQEVFVVNESLQRLRRECTQDAICAAASVTHKTVCSWKKDPQLSRAFEAVKAGKVRGSAPLDPDPLATVSPETLSRMEAYARAAKIDACCERAGFLVPNYYHYLREAEQRGVRKELERYLGVESPIPAGPVRCRLARGRFFVPTPGMFAFRKVAAKVKATDPLGSKALKGCPGYDDLLNRWTVTPRRNGERRLLHRTLGVSGVISRHLDQRLTEPQLRPEASQVAINTTESELYQARTTANQGPPRTHKHPAQAKHQQWKEWKDAGLSYNQIVQKHKDTTGEEVTRDAVIQALRRL
jgi:hypothetical protein